MENKVHEVLILGTGPSGLTAALYTARANLQPLVLQVRFICISSQWNQHPFAGNATWRAIDYHHRSRELSRFYWRYKSCSLCLKSYIRGIDGNQLIDNMTKQAERFGAQIKFGIVKEVDFSSRPFTVKTGGEVIWWDNLTFELRWDNPHQIIDCCNGFGNFTLFHSHRFQELVQENWTFLQKLLTGARWDWMLQIDWSLM